MSYISKPQEKYLQQYFKTTTTATTSIIERTIAKATNRNITAIVKLITIIAARIKKMTDPTRIRKQDQMQVLKIEKNRNKK